MTAKRKAPGTAWTKGMSGNPKGRPRGARNRATQMAMALLEADAEQIIQAIVSAARGGDMAACRMILDRLVPPAKERPISLALPSTSTAAGIAEAQAAILEAVAVGDLMPGEATALAGIVEARRKAIETAELEFRIAALEASHAKS